MSVISKVKAVEILNNGGYLHWDSFCAKGCISEKNDKFIGTLRYKTYKELCKLTEIKTEKTNLGWVDKKFLKKDEVLKNKTIDNLDLKEKMKFIHENELIAILGMVTSGEYDSLLHQSKETIRNKLFDLKICLGYMIEDYLNENIEESE